MSESRSTPSRREPARGESRNAAKTRARFPRRLRLLKHADFDRVYKEGRRHFSTQLTVFYLRRESGVEKVPTSRKPRDVGHPRIGFTVGRVLGGAVERNRMKRRLREAVRRHHGLLTSPVDVVINPKKSALRVEFSTLLEEVERGFALIARRMAEGQEGRAKT